MGVPALDDAQGKKQVWRPHVRTWDLFGVDLRTDESTRDIAGTFRHPPEIRHPGHWAPLDPLAMPLKRCSLYRYLGSILPGPHDSFLIFVTAIGGRLKPEVCFLPGRLRWTLLPKERYGNSLSGCGSTTQPSNWEADTLPLSYCRLDPHDFTWLPRTERWTHQQSPARRRLCAATSCRRDICPQSSSCAFPPGGKRRFSKRHRHHWQKTKLLIGSSGEKLTQVRRGLLEFYK